MRRVASHLGGYAGDAAATLVSAGLGLVIGLVVGIGLAVLATSSRVAHGLDAAPLTLLLPTVPIVVVIPIVARIVGYDQRTVVITAVLMAFFPIFVLTAAGLRTRPPGADDVFGTFRPGGASRLWLHATVRGAQHARGAADRGGQLLPRRPLRRVADRHQRRSGTCSARDRVQLETEAAWGAIMIAIVLCVMSYLSAEALDRQAVRPRIT